MLVELNYQKRKKEAGKKGEKKEEKRDRNGEKTEGKLLVYIFINTHFTYFPLHLIQASP